jgi:HSF-type DNA-binding
MLQCVADSSQDGIVSWLCHGRAFRVHDRKIFVPNVLPVYFGNHREYASFQRQLNIYNFLRLANKGPDQGAYYHELFLRGRQDLCALIPRNPHSTHSVRCIYDETTESDLAAFPRLSEPDSTLQVLLTRPRREQCAVAIEQQARSTDVTDDSAVLETLMDRWIAQEQARAIGAQPLPLPAYSWSDTT